MMLLKKQNNKTRKMSEHTAGCSKVQDQNSSEWQHRVTKAFLDRKVQLMTQIVFVNIIEICFLMTYVVLTVTCRNEFDSGYSFGAVWLCILAYFLFYVRSGYTFVGEF